MKFQVAFEGVAAKRYNRSNLGLTMAFNRKKMKVFKADVYQRDCDKPMVFSTFDKRTVSEGCVQQTVMYDAIEPDNCEVPDLECGVQQTVVNNAMNLDGYDMIIWPEPGGKNNTKGWSFKKVRKLSSQLFCFQKCKTD